MTKSMNLTSKCCKILSLSLLIVVGKLSLSKDTYRYPHSIYRSATTNLVSNTAGGAGALAAIVDGVENTAFGRCALSANTTGNSNSALGEDALISNTTGGGNTATGVAALRGSTTGNSNTANGICSLISMNGSGNTALGACALSASGANGNQNTAVGFDSGKHLTGGNFNVYLGVNSGIASSGSESNIIRIGAGSGNEKPSSCYIQGIKGSTTNSVTPNVRVGTDGQLFEVITGSSRRYKENIDDIGHRSSKVLDLRPVSFQYKKDWDKNQALHYGLIAEEVAEHMPELVEYDENGNVESVKYSLLSSLLLNEVKKLSRKVEELENKLNN